MLSLSILLLRFVFGSRCKTDSFTFYVCIVFRNNQERAVHGGEREGGPKKLLFVNFGTMCASKRVGRVRISCWHCIQYTIYLSLSVHTQLIRTTRTLFVHIVVSHWRSMIVLFFGCKENLKKEFWEKNSISFICI